MLRKDGAYKIYIIQAQIKGYRDDEWFYHSDRFCHFKDDENIKRFTASGECWQETGIHGTYDREYALKVLRKVKLGAKKYAEKDDGYNKTYKKMKFRVACLSIAQSTVPVK